MFVKNQPRRDSLIIPDRQDFGVVTLSRDPLLGLNLKAAPTDNYSLSFKPELVVWDVDGTLVNSEPTLRRGIFEATESMLSAEWTGFELSASDQDYISANCMGVSEEELAKRVRGWMRNLSKQKQLSLGELDTISNKDFFAKFVASRFQHFQTEALSGQIEILPGVIDCIAALYEQSGAMAINTGSVRSFATVSIDTVIGGELKRMYGLDSREVFPEAARVFSDELPEGLSSKPHPLGYIVAQTRLADLKGCTTVQNSQLNSVIFGDRPNDLIAGLSACARLYIAVPEKGRLPSFFGGTYAVEDYLKVHHPASALANPARIVFLDSLERLEVA